MVARISTGRRCVNSPTSLAPPNWCWAPPEAMTRATPTTCGRPSSPHNSAQCMSPVSVRRRTCSASGEVMAHREATPWGSMLLRFGLYTAEAGARTEQMGLIEEAAKLVRVRYGDKAIREMIAEVLRAVHRHPSKHAFAQSVLLPALAGVKDAAFDEEREWRLVVVTDDEPRFRPGPLGVTPYITLRYPADAIAEGRRWPRPRAGIARGRCEAAGGRESRGSVVRCPVVVRCSIAHRQPALQPPYRACLLSTDRWVRPWKQRVGRDS